MLLKDYKKIKDLTEPELIEYFKIDTTQTVEKVGEDLLKCLEVKDVKFKYFRIGKRIYKMYDEIESIPYWKWIILDQLIAGKKDEEILEVTNIIIAALLQKLSWNGWVDVSKGEIDSLANKINDLSMEKIKCLTFFLSKNVTAFMKNIKTFYWVETSKMTNNEIRQAIS